MSGNRNKQWRATARTWKIIAVFTSILAILLFVMLVRTAATAHPAMEEDKEPSPSQAAALNALPAQPVQPAAQDIGSTLSGKRVLIDPGHGDTDVGTIGPLTGRYESEVNLEISLKLRDALTQKGVDVVMTRESDEPLAAENEQDVTVRKEADMVKREEIIENTNADFLLSIHQNRFDDASVAGPQVFYLKTQDGQEYWADFARAIQGALNERLPVENPRGISPGDWRLLKKGGQPGCIIECGFFSNPAEETLLQTEEYQNEIVAAIVAGLEGYVNGG
ncbi:MAG TPA: N-acetylmuramoyl-L-alanine amidase [Clostridiales bacterium]|nr:N-acetylmuramoyl-L-alanine amidase [Clostridiales bacterium]